MPDLLIEFLSEEIPARMQSRAAEDLRKMVTDRLVAAGLVYEGAKAFATPRRLALSVHGIPARQPDIKDERKGPKVGAPEQAIAGFLKAAGLKSIGEAKVQADKKGDFYVALIEKPRPGGDRCHCRHDSGGRAHVSVAKIDALGVRATDLGASAAFDHGDLWPRDGRTRNCAVRQSTASRRET